MHSEPLIVAISSRALFDLDESNRIFEQQGIKEYKKYQIAHEKDPLARGVAFHLAKKLLELNRQEKLIEIVLLSRNSADTGLRTFNSIQHYQIDIKRAVFTSGNSPFPYINALGAHLFLSAHPEDVGKALTANIAAATILPTSNASISHSHQLRIAFDGDAVLFSDEAERVYQQTNLRTFAKAEKKLAEKPLEGGPFKAFLAALHRIQSLFPSDTCPIRTALVTARSAPAHERVIKTLRAWNIRIDEALFLGGLPKGAFLKAFGADIFFDDQASHCESASEHVPTGHVPHGVKNEDTSVIE